MKDTGQDENWVFVIVSNAGSDEEYLGLWDKEKDINFIPAFKSRDDANDCFITIPREKGRKYEIQAIFFDELLEDASKNGFDVAIVDSEGHILEMIKRGNKV